MGLESRQRSPDRRRHPHKSIDRGQPYYRRGTTNLSPLQIDRTIEQIFAAEDAARAARSQNDPVVETIARKIEARPKGAYNTTIQYNGQRESLAILTPVAIRETLTSLITDVASQFPPGERLYDHYAELARRIDGKNNTEVQNHATAGIGGEPAADHQARMHLLALNAKTIVGIVDRYTNSVPPERRDELMTAAVATVYHDADKIIAYGQGEENASFVNFAALEAVASHLAGRRVYYDLAQHYHVIHARVHQALDSYPDGLTVAQIDRLATSLHADFQTLRPSPRSIAKLIISVFGAIPSPDELAQAENERRATKQRELEEAATGRLQESIIRKALANSPSVSRVRELGIFCIKHLPELLTDQTLAAELGMTDYLTEIDRLLQARRDQGHDSLTTMQIGSIFGVGDEAIRKVLVRAQAYMTTQLAGKEGQPSL